MSPYPPIIPTMKLNLNTFEKKGYPASILALVLAGLTRPIPTRTGRNRKGRETKCTEHIYTTFNKDRSNLTISPFPQQLQYRKNSRQVGTRC